MATSEPTLVAEFFGMKSHGLIFGTVGGGFTIGAAVGPLVVGYCFDVAGDYRTSLLICAGISVLGLILTSSLTPIKLNPIKSSREGGAIIA